jgi:hypothetical protein
MPVVGITHSSRKVVPSAPTIGTATDVGTGRAYNDGAITVTFTPADLYATSFTASAYDNLAAVTRTATGSSSPLTITGFRSTASTTATVTASNAIGTSAASAASNSVTVTTVPLAPSTIGTLSLNGSGSLSLNTWGSVTNSSPSNGGKTISSYRARLFPGSLSSATGDLASPGTTVWNSLTGGNSYTANGYAVNANGESAASPSSNSATVGLAPVLSTNPSFTASGNQVTLTSGTWANTPTSYTYQIASSLANLNAGTYVLNSTTTNSSATYTGSYSTTYHGKVTATNAYGSATSGNLTATTGANLAPVGTANPQITPHPTLDRFTVTSGSWTNSPTSYIYYLYPGAGGTLIGSSGSTSATSFVFQDTMGYDIQYSTSYQVIVEATNAYGSGAMVSPTASTVAYVPPPAPTPTGSISASNIGSSSCNADFTVSNAASWDVRGSYIGGAFFLSGLNPSTGLVVSNLPSGANGVSIVLNMWTGANRTGTLYQASTTINVPTASSGATTPTGLVNTYSSGPSWTGSWNASNGTPTIYYYWELNQSQTNGGPITAFAYGTTTGTSFTQSMSSANGLWAYFTVNAYNNVGSSGTATSGWA